jgi:endo-alpha-1,4-polygalactosaminidase (GH114 family)
MHENRTLKTENSQLERFREKVRKQHEVLTRENEKLARKLEKVMREQGQSVKIVSNPGEYVIVQTDATSAKSTTANSNASSSMNFSSSGGPNTTSNVKGKVIKSNSTQLPPIEKMQQSQNFSNEQVSIH